MFGGPYGESYSYQDLAPRPPRNLTAEITNEEVKLTWLKNTEADLSHYCIYRDSAPNFVYDSTKLLTILTDTVFVHKLTVYSPEKVYYKVTAVDGEGNQSPAGNEVAVTLTGVEDEKIIINDNQLFPNYPNPFNASTVLSFRLSDKSMLKIGLFDIQGEKIAELINEERGAGYYEYYLSTDKYKLTSGIYLVKMDVVSENKLLYSDIKKIMLVK